MSPENIDRRLQSIGYRTSVEYRSHAILVHGIRGEDSHGDGDIGREAVTFFLARAIRGGALGIKTFEKKVDGLVFERIDQPRTLHECMATAAKTHDQH